MALGWIFVILSGVLPTGRLFLLFLASLIVATAYFELRISGAVLLALGISVLSLMYPGVIHALAFAIFAGPLPLIILRLYRSGLSKFLQYLISHSLMSLILIAVIRIVGLDSFIVNRLNLETWLIWLIIFVAFQIVLLAYRYALLNYEAFYFDRIKPWLHRK
ncbi:MAG: hypothetical protein PHR37_03190 [Eubacteriales bacterium]|nr:hypothetical protein [Eubacteriales bacterium]